MTAISNDTEFRQALDRLDTIRQRVVAARFVEHVLPLSNDERLAMVTRTAARRDAPDSELVAALGSARAATFDSHTRCGSEGDWSEQAGYFVARAAAAAVTPAGQLPGGSAWQAAVASRMARTCESISQDAAADNPANEEIEAQYSILSEFLDS
ncbi:MAG: hypothetical protein OEU44_01660 [Gammaproteobacteria bacterium]|nr:hypothetical protein [Gammaproteobacteria bacterium]